MSVKIVNSFFVPPLNTSLPAREPPTGTPFDPSISVFQARPRPQDPKDEAIHTAARSMNLAALQTEVEKNPDAVKAFGADGKTALMICCELGFLPGARYLVSKKSEVNPKLVYLDDGKEKRDHRLSPLMLAAQVGSVDIASLLIDNGAEVNDQNRGKQTALMLAARAGAPEVIHYLLNRSPRKVDTSLQDVDGRTADDYAVDSLKMEVVDALVPKNFPMRIRDLKAAIYRKAAEIGDLDLVKKCLSARGHNIEVDYPSKKDETAFILACQNGRTEVVKYFVEKTNYRIDAQNHLGETALMLAGGSAEQREEITNRLLNLARPKPNLEIRDRQGRTVLMRRALEGDLRSVELIADAKPDFLAKEALIGGALEYARLGRLKAQNEGGSADRLKIFDTEIALLEKKVAEATEKEKEKEKKSK